MKPLTQRTVGLTLGAATLIVLLAANHPATSAEPSPGAGSVTNAVPGDEPILAVRPPGGALPANYKASETLTEVVKMAQAGVSEEVLLTYINNAGKAFNPSPEDIIFLNDLGVSEPVIKALINSKAGATAATTPKPAVTATAPANSTAAAPVQAPAPVTTAPAINGAVAQPAPDAAAPPPAAATSTTVIVQPAQVATVSYFYDSLAPYGSWVNVSGFGWCWQPTIAVANVGWRPYCDGGRWVYSNFGWYWQSDYSWGWAPFHYGRWHRHNRCGWVWVPDTVWGASWVSWRYNNAYCGWAPLPPAAHFRPGFGFSWYGGSVGVGFDFGISVGWYNFVPIGRFCDRTPRRHVVQDNRTIINNTVVNNNYVIGNNNTIINNGVSRETITRVSQTPVTQVNIRDAIVQNHSTLKNDRIARVNNADVIYRPKLVQGDVNRITEVLRQGRDLHSGRSTGSTPPAAVVATPGAGSPGQPAVDARRITGNTRGRPASETTQRPGPAPTQTAPVVATPAPSPKPAVSDKKLSQERLNQLVEEARTRNRERSEPLHHGRTTIPPAAQQTVPAAKLAPQPAPSYRVPETPRPAAGQAPSTPAAAPKRETQPRPAQPQVRVEDSLRQRIEASPQYQRYQQQAPQFQHRGQSQAPAPAAPAIVPSVRTEVQRPAAPAPQSRENYRGERGGDSNRGGGNKPARGKDGN